MAPVADAGTFPGLKIAVMEPERGTVAWETAYEAKLVIRIRARDLSPVITLENQSTGTSVIHCVLSNRTVWRAGSSLFFVSPLPGGMGGTLYAVQCPSKSIADQLQCALDAALGGPGSAAGQPTPQPQPGGDGAAAAADAATGPLSNGDVTAAADGVRGRGPDGYASGHTGRQNGFAPSLSPVRHTLASPGPAPLDGGLAGTGPAATGGGAGSAPGWAGTAAEGDAADGPRADPGPPCSSPPHPGLPPQHHRDHRHQQHQPQQRQQQQQVRSPATGSGTQPPTTSTGGGGETAAGLGAAAGSPPGIGAGSGPAGATTAAADAPSTAGNHFDRKICRTSSDNYFHYYGMLQHQQNMLQDYTRTGIYHTAILNNPEDFRGRTVLDVGAGSGILSLFAAQAGAEHVYAVEASGMARYARQLADANPALGSRITVINGKVEEVTLPERVDVLVSEPMGTLLVNERMLESYIYARDAFLKPGGKMFPQLGRIHAAAFSDEVLHAEVAAKSAFWLQPYFCGVDLTALHPEATEGYFAQVVVDAFDPSLLVSSCATRALDFGTMPESELLDIDMPLQLVTSPVAPLTIHGLACWFDVFFAGAQQPTWLTTAPGMPTTHWFQLRCVLQQPLTVLAPNTLLTGRLRLVAHARQSYDIYLTLTAPPLQPGQPPQTSSGKFDLKEPYYRQLTPHGAAAAAAAMAGQAMTVGADAGVAAAGAPVAGVAPVWGW